MKNESGGRIMTELGQKHILTSFMMVIVIKRVKEQRNV